MNTAVKSQMGPSEWAMLLVLSILWGGAFFFSEVALRDLPPFSVVFLRLALGAAALWVVFLATVPSDQRQNLPWAAFAMMGLLNNAIPFSLLVWGQTEISSSLASIINAGTPFFTVAVAYMFLKDERLSAIKIGGVIVGFIGILVLFGPEALSGDISGFWGQVACVGATISYAFAGVYGRRFGGLPPLATATGQVTCSSFILLPLVLLVDQPWALPVPGWDVWGSVLGMAIGSTTIAYILFFRILQTSGATNVMLVTFLVPVSAIVLGTLVLGEVLLPKHLVGMALIGAGLAVIDGRLLSLFSGRRQSG